jgi:ABC-type bacteriocin/lantibiotic exporter with double-glycine peptidase domain
VNYIILEKAKPYVRTRKGKMERVKGYTGRSKQEDPSDHIIKAHSKAIVDKMSGVMKLFKQSVGMCGPASIRIALSKYGKNYTENQIAKIAHSSAAEGTDNPQLIKAIKDQGISTVEYKNFKPKYALNTLKHYIDSKNPVIISWMKTKVGELEDAPTYKEIKILRAGKKLYAQDVKKMLDAVEYEHFSVVKKVTGVEVIILDPLEDKEQKLPIKYFMDRWWDNKNKRWFLVLTGETT